MHLVNFSSTLSLPRSFSFSIFFPLSATADNFRAGFFHETFLPAILLFQSSFFRSLFLFLPPPFLLRTFLPPHILSSRPLNSFQPSPSFFPSFRLTFYSCRRRAPRSGILLFSSTFFDEEAPRDEGGPVLIRSEARRENN